MPPIINESKCIKCGVCVDICSEDVFFGSKKKEFLSALQEKSIIQ